MVLQRDKPVKIRCTAGDMVTVKLAGFDVIGDTRESGC